MGFKCCELSNSQSSMQHSLVERRFIFGTPLLKPLWLNAHLGGDVVAMRNVQQIYQSAH
jgi:hypothetical protein